MQFWHIVQHKDTEAEMETLKVIQQHKRIGKLISEKKVKQSLDILDGMISESSAGFLRDEYDNIVLTYRNILRYTIEGVKDPETE